MTDSSKIIFLGTGGSRQVMAYQNVSTAGIIIQTDNHQIHLDPGPGALIRAKQFSINPHETNIFLVSHDHIDHCNDINALIDAAHIHHNKKIGTLISTKELIEGNENIFPYLTKYHKNFLQKHIILEPEKKIKVDSITIQAKKAIHNTETIGFKIYTKKFTLGYTADTGYFRGIGNQYKNCDILILNMELPFGKKSKHYLSADDIVKILKTAKPKLAILTHFGTEDIIKNSLYTAREITKKSNIQTIAAKDGLVIEPTSYSATIKQKTLLFQ